MRISRKLGFLFAAALLFSGATIWAQSFKVLVLDALNGKPDAGMYVTFMCEDGHGWSPADEVATDASGVAEVPFRCDEGTKIDVDTYVHVLPADNSKYGKSGCGGGVQASLEDILSVGFISDPSSAGGLWCSKKISKMLKPVPGQVILFVKKPTWYQVYIAP